MNELKTKVEAEINACRDEIIKFLDSDFIKNNKNIEATVHYKTMMAVQYSDKITYSSSKTTDEEIEYARNLIFEACCNETSGSFLSTHTRFCIEVFLFSSYKL